MRGLGAWPAPCQHTGAQRAFTSRCHPTASQVQPRACVRDTTDRRRQQSTRSVCTCFLPSQKPRTWPEALPSHSTDGREERLAGCDGLS